MADEVKCPVCDYLVDELGIVGQPSGFRLCPNCGTQFPDNVDQDDPQYQTRILPNV